MSSCPSVCKFIYFKLPWERRLHLLEIQMHQMLPTKKLPQQFKVVYNFLYSSFLQKCLVTCLIVVRFSASDCVNPKGVSVFNSLQQNLCVLQLPQILLSPIFERCSQAFLGACKQFLLSTMPFYILNSCSSLSLSLWKDPM